MSRPSLFTTLGRFKFSYETWCTLSLRVGSATW
jgi:hypothetical protein